MSGAAEAREIVLEGVSKFYGEVLGISHVSLRIPPGVTSLVGPNGSGKSTLMNLVTGLIRPTRGRVEVLGVATSDAERLFRLVGYCAQFDSFPRRLTGWQFVEGYLRVHGYSADQARRMTAAAIERVGLSSAAKRRIGGYSKGMRQRIKLALAIAHSPAVLVLDEPLNGLDPLARAEIIALFRELAREGQHVLISSHILHEVDLLSDRVLMLKEGQVIAAGDIQSVRGEIHQKPLKISIRCDRPARLASRVFDADSVVEAGLHDDGAGLLVSTRDPQAFYLLLNRLVLEESLAIESVEPADENVHAVYRYLVGGEEEGP